MSESTRDMIVHTWEAPSCVASVCVGHFEAGRSAQCAFAQHGGLSIFEASPNVVEARDELHAYDQLQKVVAIPVGGAALPCYYRELVWQSDCGRPSAHTMAAGDPCRALQLAILLCQMHCSDLHPRLRRSGSLENSYARHELRCLQVVMRIC
jgi:hypothetical protein